jgi:hypothetical protein
MLRLMSSLLGKCGIFAAADAETRNPFESLLKQHARRVFLMQEETDFPDRVSQFIVSSQRVQRWQEEQTTTSVVKGLSNILSLLVGSDAFVVRCLLILASMDAKSVAIYDFAAGCISI